MADQIALAMGDSISFRASQQAQERLQLLLDLTNRVVSNLNLRDVLREISANIRRVTFAYDARRWSQSDRFNQLLSR